MSRDPSLLFKNCEFSGHGKSVKSDFPKGCVPIRYFYRHPDNPKDIKVLKHCADCRKYRDDRRKTNKNKCREERDKNMTTQYRECINKKHDENSILPSKKIPIESFKLSPNREDSKLSDNCAECRNNENLIRIDNKNKHKEEFFRLREETASSNFTICREVYHYLNDPIHDRFNIPIELFMINPNDISVGLYNYCLACRNAKSSRNWKIISELEEQCEDNQFVCHKCHFIVENENMSRNFDGDIGTYCLYCQKLRTINRANRLEKLKENCPEGKFLCLYCRKYFDLSLRPKTIYGRECNECEDCKVDRLNYYDRIDQKRREIKYNFIKDMQSSCNICNHIFLRSFDEYDRVEEYETFEENGFRYFYYRSIKIKVFDVLDYFREWIELNVLEFDHLPEEEMRLLGLLSENQVYSPKRYVIASIQNPIKMERESRKCQLINKMCHLDITVDRAIENGENHNLMERKSQERKFDYVNNLKRDGCVICGFNDHSIPRVFHMDHLDRVTKTCIISGMIKNNKYTLQDVIDECKKCRPLCVNCHSIHTKKQFNSKYYREEYKQELIIKKKEFLSRYLIG